ncbi:universal stress protein [Yinghuangia sp. YIM S09857]|uniref:universal stress protein n=1 Tax=Yinghuangia sp. YIM S09857 TaxID=3436929 RepID=UPI003F53527F
MDSRIRHLKGHVVVGVDGSASATHAVRGAAAEAVRRGVPLQVLHAADPAQYASQSGSAAYAAAHELVDAAARQALDVAPWLDVERTVMRATPVGALLDASDDAGVVVIGNRGLGPLSALALGSVGVSLAARSRCPVLVEREAADAATEGRREVVVGVSGAACAPAVELALQEAALRGARLRVVHAWSMPMVSRVGAFSSDGVVTVASMRAHARARLAAIVRNVRDAEPTVVVREDVVRDSAARALIAASRHAELLVLAARQRPPGPGLHVGTVTRAVLHRAQCSVLVVPVARTGPAHRSIDPASLPATP